MLIRQNDSRCPNLACGNTLGSKHDKGIKQKVPGDPLMVCGTCGETWHPSTDGMRNVPVKVIEPLSIWKGKIGHIKEILPHSGRNIRVAFPPSKTDTFADLFHSAHLEEIDSVPVGWDSI